MIPITSELQVSIYLKLDESFVRYVVMKVSVLEDITVVPTCKPWIYVARCVTVAANQLKNTSKCDCTVHVTTNADSCDSQSSDYWNSR